MIVVSFFFADCGKKTESPPEPSAAEESASESGAEPGPEGDEGDETPGAITVEEKIVYENEGLVITLKGFVEGEEGRLSSWPKIQFLVENGTPEHLKIRTTESSVNGVMVNSYMKCEVGPGERADAEMGLFTTDLKRANIEKIIDVDFIFHFIGETSATDYRYSDVVSIRIAADNSYMQTYDDSGVLLVDQGGIKIVNQGLSYENDISDRDLSLYIENNSNDNVRVRVKSCYVNGVLIEFYTETVVLSGKKAYTAFTFKKATLLSNGVEDIELLEIVFEISESRSYALIFDSEEVLIKVDGVETTLVPNAEETEEIAAIE